MAAPQLSQGGEGYSCGVQEEIWEKIQAHRSEVRAANKPFSENRSFSSSVRELIKKGQLEEACKLCRAQVTPPPPPFWRLPYLGK
jgi:hypothetical protein